MAHYRVSIAEDDTRQRRIAHDIRKQMIHAAGMRRVRFYDDETSAGPIPPPPGFIYRWEAEMQPAMHHRRRSHLWHEYPRPHPFQRGESSLSNRAVFGDDERGYQNLPFVPPHLAQIPTWSSTEAQDGYDSEDGQITTRVIELLDDSSNIMSDEDIIEPYGPTTEPIQTAAIRAESARQDADQSGSMVEAIFFYCIVCIFVVVLRNIPGLFSTLFGWDAWVGGDELGAGGELEGPQYNSGPFMASYFAATSQTMDSNISGGTPLKLPHDAPKHAETPARITVHWRAQHERPPIESPYGSKIYTTNKKPEDAKYPQWYAVTDKPTKATDKLGYFPIIAANPDYEACARILGLQKAVIPHIKQALRRRYWNKKNFLVLDYGEKQTRERLAEEINIGMRGYATKLTKILRAGKGSKPFLEATKEQWKPWDQLSQAVYKHGNYKSSGFLLYKLCEGLIQELRAEKQAARIYAYRMCQAKKRVRERNRREKGMRLPLMKTRQGTSLLKLALIRSGENRRNTIG
ncbi:hypothetical protein TWF694_000235 [Orbilia ellipsospora]|uniref:Uncharacterized protein n=1 Tax=Orbilia ellipsospora TaxID=2528407 RepID=A0AAV9XMZ9_9PEZI